MERYTTFLLPQFVESRMLYIWITATAIALFLLLFFIWKSKPKPIFANLAGFFTVIAILLIPVVHFGTPLYNNKMMADTVAKDYGVVVSTAVNPVDMLVVHSGGVYKCTVNSKDQIHYYVLCNVPEGVVFLDDITAGKFGQK